MKFKLGVARKKRRTLPLVFALGLICVSASGANIIDLGTFGGDRSFAIGINDNDQIVGLAAIPGNQLHSFLYANGQMTDLYPLNSQDLLTLSLSINNVGQIASGVIATDGIYYPAVYDSRTNVITVLGSLGGVTTYGFNGVATSINNSGQATGYSYVNSLHRHAFIFENGAMRDISPAAVDAAAFDINNSGQVVGETDRAFLYSNGVLADISPFNSPQSYALAINSYGLVVGQYLNVNKGASRAFIYKLGRFQDIGSDNSSDTIAYDINDRGQVVGATYVLPNWSCKVCNDYGESAFIYQNATMTELDNLLPPGSGWHLMYAFGINNKGIIVGVGLINGQLHAFMLKL